MIFFLRCVRFNSWMGCRFFFFFFQWLLWSWTPMDLTNGMGPPGLSSGRKNTTRFEYVLTAENTSSCIKSFFVTTAFRRSLHPPLERRVKRSTEGGQTWCGRKADKQLFLLFKYVTTIVCISWTTWDQSSKISTITEKHNPNVLLKSYWEPLPFHYY